MRANLLAGVIASMLMFSPSVEAQTLVRYVDVNATGGNNGLNWGDAYTNLSAVLAIAREFPGTYFELWVAEGTYRPDVSQVDGDDDRVATFTLADNVALRGGFAGVEVDRDDRDPVNNPTILSGDIGDRNDVTDNVYHVVSAIGSSPLALVSGFVITGGRADGESQLSHELGGGIYVLGGAPTIVDCTVEENTAKRHGGGIYCGDGAAPQLTDCTIMDNSAELDGGGLYVNADSADGARMTGSTLADNEAGRNGGGIYLEGGHLTLEDCDIEDNEAGGDGGGMYSTGGGVPEITDGSRFEGNEAEGNGGGMYNLDVAVKLYDCTFDDNSAEVDGGAMYNKNLDSTTDIADLLFEDNGAGANGGAVVNDDSGFYVMESCDFVSNHASDRGGALYVIDGSNPIHKKCRFLSNGAALGGAVSIQDLGGAMVKPDFYDCLFAGNAATAGGGGAIQSFDSRASIVNCTIVANQAPIGGGIYARTPEDGTDLPDLRNCIVYYNTDDSGTDLNAQLRLVNATVDELIDDGQVIASCIRGINAAEGNISDDPGFVDADGTEDDQWRLGAHSPCIDAGFGDPAGFDLEGKTRSVDDPVVENTGPDGNVDMGAYEYQYDCNSNGVVDSADLADGLSSDCADNGVPDECEEDSDRDGTIDSCDGCPDDRKKTAPGSCGCGKPEDENTNGIPDCQEEDVTDGDDVDGDGKPNASDNCPQIANVSQADRDGDNTGDACDACPDDGQKTTPGICGCGTADADADGDDVVDCNDNCPDDANPTQDDLDDDGLGDVCDGCPTDVDKTEPGACGCGQRDFDSDLDGVLNCLDACPGTPPGVQVESSGCEAGGDGPSGQPLDSDGDGVTDDLDDCPNTAAGQAVDNDGCPVAEPSPTPVPTTTTSCGVLGMAAPFMLLTGMAQLAMRTRRRTRRGG